MPSQPRGFSDPFSLPLFLALSKLQGGQGCSTKRAMLPPPRGAAVWMGSGELDVKMLVSSCLLCSSSLLACATVFFGFHLHKLDCARFRVLGSDHPITATAGGDVVLPCRLSPRLNAEHMEVRWFRSRFSIYVHLYHSGQDHFSSQMPEYQGRTEFLKGGVSDGNVSLRILRTRLSDEGQYQCLVKDGNFYEEATLELKVAVSGSSPLLSVEDYQDGGIRVGCRAAGWYPKPEMLWRDFQGQQLPSFTESASQDKNGFFQVEKTIIILKNSKQNVSCSVQNTRLPQEKDSSIYISDAIFPKVSPWMVTLFATLAGCSALLIFFLLIYQLRAKYVTELEKRSAEIRKYHGSSVPVGSSAGRTNPASGCLLRCMMRAGGEEVGRTQCFCWGLGEQMKCATSSELASFGERDMEIQKLAAELLHVTLDADTAHPQLILSTDGKKVRRGDTRQPMPDNPERYDTYHCVLGQEGFVSGRCFWEVDVGTEEGGVWAMGVARESMKRKGWINPAPQDGILAIFHCGGKYWALTSPDHTALLLTQMPRTIRVYLDFEGQKVAFFNADNQDLLFSFPLAPLSGEKIRPWFRVGPIAQLSLKSPLPAPRVSSMEEPLLPSCFPLKTLSTGQKTPCTPEGRA
ncbi:butyrophilin subfamily 1 member A1-like isoform X2 [Oxyura jamaicensis]|uniref:butyrophilin subfamily 1 member A1-like isoform X2 n=1 Tax=Oxyura jamaicensis TaxID=8884 RepID=UPI0015A65E84|nr:butyrophilin subfamily 1 member A1-like isoform X2 [Oxyura jamaicensis]